MRTICGFVELLCKLKRNRWFAYVKFALPATIVNIAFKTVWV